MGVYLFLRLPPPPLFFFFIYIYHIPQIDAIPIIPLFDLNSFGPSFFRMNSSSSAAEIWLTSDDLNSSSFSAAEIWPTSDDLNSSYSSAAGMGPTSDDFNSSSWSPDIDLIFSINTPNLPVEIEEIFNEFNTSDLPARPPEVEFTRSSSAENFTDTGS